MFNDGLGNTAYCTQLATPDQLLHSKYILGLQKRTITFNMAYIL